MHMPLRPSPRFFRIAAPFFLLFLAIAIFAPMFWGGWIPFNEERMGNFYPLSVFFGHAMMNGTGFLWDPYYYGGFPAFADLSGGFLSPLHQWIFSLFQPFSAHFLIECLTVAGGLLAGYFFGRYQSLSVRASLLLTISFLLSRSYDGLTMGLFSGYDFLLLPLLALVLTVLSRPQKRITTLFFFVLGVLGITAGLIGGHPQMQLYTLLLGGVCALIFDAVAATPQTRWYRRTRSIKAYTLMVFCGGLLASPQLIHSYAIGQLSVRTTAYSAAAATPTPITNLVSFLLPPSIHIPFLNGQIFGAYIGALGFFFALVTIFFFRTRLTRLFAWSYLVILAISLRLPVFAEIHDHLPILGRTSGTGRFLALGAFFFCFLAAFGYDRLGETGGSWEKREMFTKWMRWCWRGVVLFVVGCGVAMVALFILQTNNGVQESVFTFLTKQRSLSLPREHYRTVFSTLVNQTAATLSFRNPFLLLSLLFLPLSLWLVARTRQTPRAQWLQYGIFLLLIINAGTTFAAEFPTLFIRRAEQEKIPQVVHAIRAQESDLSTFRILPFLTAEGLFLKTPEGHTLTTLDRARYSREAMVGELGSVSGISTMQGIEPLRALRQHLLVDAVIAPHLRTVVDDTSLAAWEKAGADATFPVARLVSPEEKIQDVLSHLPLLSLLNVKYLVTPYEINDPRLEAIPLPADPELPIPLFLYKNPAARPPLFFATKPHLWKEGDRALLRMLASTTDPLDETFIECPSCLSAAQEKNPGTITIVHDTPGDVLLKTDRPTDGWLVLHQAFFPGWQVTIDGDTAPVSRADYLFQAVFVPAGSHTIHFTYTNIFWETAARWIPASLLL